jgi:hypothetical protein
MSTTDQPSSAAEPDAIEPSEAPATPPARSGVRWKRFGAMFGITAVLTGTLVALTAEGVLAANFSISGMPFVITATSLEGSGFEQYAQVDSMLDDSPWQNGEGPDKVVIVSAIDTANLTKLCQSVDMANGALFMKITAGDAGTDVTAKTLLVDSDLIQGDASFNKIVIGQDASTFTEVPGIHPTDSGIFGQQADHVEILNLRQNNYATTASVFKLPHLRMSFSSTGC